MPTHPPHEVPPHEKRKRSWVPRLIVSVALGSVITTIVSLALWFAQVPIAVILPVAAPVWVGTMTLSYTALGDKFS